MSRTIALALLVVLALLAPHREARAALTGEQRVLVILVNFQDQPDAQPIDATKLRRSLFDEASAFWRSASFGQAWLGGDVVGYYTLPFAIGQASEELIQQYGEAAARKAAVDLGKYRHLAFAFPRLPGRGYSGAYFPLYDRLFLNGGNWDSTIDAGVLAHELGHAFGLRHSHFLTESAVAEDARTLRVRRSGRTGSIEYGDPFCIMGSAFQHPNAVQKEKLGFFGGPGAPVIETVVASGVHRIEAYESDGRGTKALKVRASTPAGESWYYLECRRATSDLRGRPIPCFEEGPARANVRSGVLVHVPTGDRSDDTSYLLNLNPWTARAGEDGPALEVGRVLRDPWAGVTIEPLSVDDGGATIRVTVEPPPPALPDHPSVELLTRYGEKTSWVAPGTSWDLNVRVTSTDTAASPAADYDLELAGVPASWVVTFPKGRTVRVAPGKTSDWVPVSIVSAPDAPVGLHVARLVARNPLAPAFAGSATRTFVIGETAAPRVRTWAEAPSVKPGSRVSMRARASVGWFAAPGATVRFDVTRPTGSKFHFDATTDASGLATYPFKVAAGEPLGRWQFTATVTVAGRTTRGPVTTFVVTDRDPPSTDEALAVDHDGAASTR